MAPYDGVADDYASDSLSFFNVLGEQLVEMVGISPGDTVLDVACGAGAVTLPAARRVGPSGRVIGIDISEGMLRHAQRRAAVENLDHVSFRQTDVGELKSGEGPHFDVGLCGFAIHLFDDRSVPLRNLAARLRPGGKVGWSIWGENALQPGMALFRSVFTGTPMPDSVPDTGDLEFGDHNHLETLMATVGFPGVSIKPFQHNHRLPTFDDYWTLMSTCGQRAAIENMPQEVRDRFRAELFKAFKEISDEDGGLSIDVSCLMVVGKVPG